MGEEIQTSALTGNSHDKQAERRTDRARKSPRVTSDRQNMLKGQRPVMKKKKKKGKKEEKNEK